MIVNFIKGLLFGSIAGGIGGLLAAPKSGNEMRKDLKVYIEETTESTLELKQSVDNLKEAVITTRKTIDETIPVVTQSLTKDIEAFKFQAQPRMDRIKTQVERLNEHVATIQAKNSSENEDAAK